MGSVKLADLSEKLVEQAQYNAAKVGVVIQRFIKGNVLDLDKSIDRQILLHCPFLKGYDARLKTLSLIHTLF